MAAVHHYVCIRLPTVEKNILLYLNYHNDNTLDRSYIPEPIRAKCLTLKIRNLYHPKNKLNQIEVHDQMNVPGGLSYMHMFI